MKLKKIIPVLLLAVLLFFAFDGNIGDMLSAGSEELLYAAENTVSDIRTVETKANADGEKSESATAPASVEAKPKATEVKSEPELDENGSYTTKEDVALYLRIYGKLPKNFVTKDEARDAGWKGGGLEKYLPGMCIGGDRFGNREGILPDAKGRKWTECDINTLGAKERGAERIVFSNDGLIYYTNDHYESFELLYE